LKVEEKFKSVKGATDRMLHFSTDQKSGEKRRIRSAPRQRGASIDIHAVEGSTGSNPGIARKLR